MLVRSRAPLRLGLAGGGTDVSPYSDEFGGCVLNATIDMFANCTIEQTDTGLIEFAAPDLGLHFSIHSKESLSLEGDLVLHKAVYNRIVADFNRGNPLSLRVTTYSDAPPGSGLGSSSTIVVAMLSAYRELLKLPLGEYDLAHLAYVIEREDCRLSGGKQDQYAATFGGFNFMEFYKDDKVIVNPLRVRPHIVNELQSSLLLYFTGVSRDSALIIEDQIHTVASETSGGVALEAMHEVKRLSMGMKESLLRGSIEGIIELFKGAWDAKKRMSKKISNENIESVANTALAAGAKAIKVSGAGGGGFMMIFVDPIDRLSVIQALSKYNGQCHRFQFTEKGAESWRVTQP